MKKQLLATLLTLTAGIAVAQTTETVEVEMQTDEVTNEVFIVVEQPPQFVGGDEAMGKYLAENLRYPKKARREGIEGRVYVQFIVEKDGSISNVETIKGIGELCDEEASRVIAKMPNWTPGTQRGQTVKVKMILPISFMLGNDDAEEDGK